MNKTITFESALKTVARFWSILSFTMILLFVIGEGLNPARMTIKEWTGFIFFPIGLSIGFVAAWKNEITGASISIISIILFGLLMGINWFIVAFAFPAALFLIHWFIIKK